MREPVVTKKGSTSPFSEAIVTEGPVVYVSGHTGGGPVDPVTGERDVGSFREQAQRTLAQIGTVLEAAGSSWEHVIKVNAFLADYKDFSEWNEIYLQFVKEPYPARTTVQAGLGALAIEVDVIARVPRE
jgi:2-iminobutanoate/2-iminopropanoate deaminase